MTQNVNQRKSKENYSTLNNTTDQIKLRDQVSKHQIDVKKPKVWVNNDIHESPGKGKRPRDISLDNDSINQSKISLKLFNNY